MDWSSDFGADYQSTSNGTSAGSFAYFQPTPVPWATGFANIRTNDSISLDLARDFAPAAMLAHGQIDIAAGGALSPSIVHGFSQHFSSVSKTNQYGVSAGGELGGTFVFNGASAGTPVHWGVEWTITILNPTVRPHPTAEAYMRVDGNPQTTLRPNGPMGPDTVITGSSFGSTANNLLTFGFGSGMFDGAGDGVTPVELLFDVRVAFSDTAFSDIPDAVAVSAPGAAGLFGLALAALFRRRRRG
jgi:uncharacterized protein (TIGR03382 family)